jgi:hypothetical protein
MRRRDRREARASRLGAIQLKGTKDRVDASPVVHGNGSEATGRKLMEASIEGHGVTDAHALQRVAAIARTDVDELLLKRRRLAALGFRDDMGRRSAHDTADGTE